VLQGSGLPLSSLQQLLSQHGVAPDSAVITTQPGSMGSSSNSNSGGAAAAFSKALVLASSADAGATLGAVAKLLQPGGSVVVQLHGGQVRVAHACNCQHVGRTPLTHTVAAARLRVVWPGSRLM
jgi:hypothetical protein